MTQWEDLAARARGLSGRLLPPEERRRLAASSDLPALAAAMEEAGFLVGPTAPGRVSPSLLERAVRRRATESLALLARRAEERAGLLSVIFEDEDRRSLRVLLRGALQGAGLEERLGALLATPGLPERVLQELARVESPAQLVGLLVLWRSPYGPPLVDEARRPHPDPFRLEAVLRTTFFSRVRRFTTDAAVRRYVTELADLENIRTLLLLVSQPREDRPEQWFLPGGRMLEGRLFRRLARESEEAAQAVEGLAERFASTAWGPVLTRHASDPAGLEEALLSAHVRILRRRAREEPLGPVPVLLYALQLRAEALDLRRVIWGVALGVPGPVLSLELLEV
jgi:vacuolar-type H+-ATPase subunit C/Vma6